MPIALPDWMSPSSRVIRMPVNPLDKSTIVSVFPQEIYTEKPTLFPGKFHIAAAPADGYSLTVIQPSSWFKEMEEGQPFLEIPVSSIQLAESIVVDWCNGLPGCNMGDSMPGLFFIPGEFDKITIVKNELFPSMLEQAKARQRIWFIELVSMTDSDFARSNGNPRSVMPLSRMAAEFLHLNRPWMKDIKAFEMTSCQFCGQLCNPMFPICANCKQVVNVERAKELGMIPGGVSQPPITPVVK